MKLCACKPNPETDELYCWRHVIYAFLPGVVLGMFIMLLVFMSKPQYIR